MSSRMWSRANSCASGERTGFTLVELLVVIAIIGILISLLLPAVQSARESARLATCKNNLKQMGMAALNHQRQWSYLPSGGWGWNWVGDPNASFGRKQSGGWIYNLLPFIEQEALWSAGKDGDINARRQANALRVSTPLHFINCPSRRPAQLFKKIYLPADCNDVPGVTRTCYAANCGDQAQNEFSGGPGDFNSGMLENLEQAINARQTGISFWRSEIQQSHIKDGITMTYMYGEKFCRIDQYYSGGGPAENETALTGYNNDNYRTGSSPPQRDNNSITGNLLFGSAHSNGVNFVMCDGSVRTIDFNIDALAHRALANRRDGTGNEVRAN